MASLPILEVKIIKGSVGKIKTQSEFILETSESTMVRGTMFRVRALRKIQLIHYRSSH